MALSLEIPSQSNHSRVVLFRTLTTRRVVLLRLCGVITSYRLSGLGVYVAVLKWISPTADYFVYRCVATIWPSATNPNAVARYAVAIDLTDAGFNHFIYDSVATPEEGGYGQYSIGIEHSNGVCGYGYAYAGDPLLPYGYPPKDGTDIVLYPDNGEATKSHKNH